MGQSLVLEDTVSSLRVRPEVTAAGTSALGENDFDALLPEAPKYRDFSTSTSIVTDEREHTATIHQIERMSTRRLVRERSNSPARRFELLQQFEGVVTDLEGDTFFAELRDLTNPKSPREMAEIYFGEISEEDKPLVVPGAVFYWSIGYETTATRQLLRISEIKFRRTALWTRKKLAEIKDEAQKMLEKLLNAQRQNERAGVGRD